MDYRLLESHPDLETESRQDFRRFLRDVLETLFLAAILFLLINTLSARIRVESISMQPTLFEGDMILVNRLAYKLGFPQRGDIIIFRTPTHPDPDPYVKRVIGLPNDKISITDGFVSVNGNLLRESYIKTPPNYSGDWKVPSGTLFVLGDNRNNSSDSHKWGYVPIESVIGKALVIYWPPENWKVLNPVTAQAASP
jgi:signal peptidase I